MSTIHPSQDSQVRPARTSPDGPHIAVIDSTSLKLQSPVNPSSKPHKLPHGPRITAAIGCITGYISWGIWTGYHAIRGPRELRDRATTRAKLPPGLLCTLRRATFGISQYVPALKESYGWFVPTSGKLAGDREVLNRDSGGLKKMAGVKRHHGGTRLKNLKKSVHFYLGVLELLDGPPQRRALHEAEATSRQMNCRQSLPILPTESEMRDTKTEVLPVFSASEILRYSVVGNKRRKSIRENNKNKNNGKIIRR
ncbi:hypothetical protein FPQ18DRAFT_310293 [Pyronema domesticum]|nr:hypothetical protein FPQ18DRAFT_310293 [Pyronema domesticum]